MNIELLEGSKQIISALLTTQLDSAQLSLPDPIAVAQYRRSIANEFFIAQAWEKAEIICFQDFVISSFFDGFEIPVRLYKVNEDTKDVVLYAHGGGWMQGNMDAFDCVYRKVAKELNRNVIAVDYRLSPENRYPIPLEDVVSAYLWASERYSNICLAGDSAGGNLCAAACVKLKQLNKPKPNSLLLFYPALGTGFQTESYEKYGDLVPLLRHTAMYYYTQYTGETCTEDTTISDPCISPILIDDMDLFPKAMIVSAECDVLLSDQIAFTKKMGDRCHQIIVGGAIHGFFSYGKAFDLINTDLLKTILKWLNKL